MSKKKKNDANIAIDDSQAVIKVIGKKALSKVPIVGGIFTTFFDICDAVNDNAYKKRLEKWQRIVEEQISKINTTLEDLGNNEHFVTMLIITTEVAKKTVQDEKLALLANALINSINTTLDEDLLIIYMNLIEKYTTTHIELLSFFATIIPQVNSENKNTNYNKVTSTYIFRQHYNITFAEIGDKQKKEKYDKVITLFDKCYNDLFNDGLVISKEQHSTGNVLPEVITKLGKEFLSFITNQEEQHNG